MHYLQNSWFTTNWLWVLSFIVLSIAVIAYINNKRSLLRQSLAGFGIMFILSVWGTLAYTDFSSAMPSARFPLQSTSQDVNNNQEGSVMETLFSYVYSIVKEKADK
jgi:hypothetical protein